MTSTAFVEVNVLNNKPPTKTQIGYSFCRHCIQKRQRITVCGKVWKCLGLQMCTMTDSARNAPVAPRSKKGLIQHKKEAFWFYRFLSIVYDNVVNPFHWTMEMRDTALKQAALNTRDLRVIDVGGGTGFCTEGIVKYVDPSSVTILDQSPHQMEKAKRKPSLQSVQLVQGDAENIPFPTNHFDRYVSAGSIEYWPEPQRGIAEAYRVLKPNGIATIIGPIRATHWFSRFWSDWWMLFPSEEEYRYWFEQAGFQDIEVSYICPTAYKGIREHGLIMGIVVRGRKPQRGNGEPLCRLGPMKESLDSPWTWKDKLLFPFRWLLGCIAGFYYFLLPFFIMLYAAIFIRNDNKTVNSK